MVYRGCLVNLRLLRGSFRFMSSRSATASDALVLFDSRDTARIVSLNRPSKLNALNSSMCESINSTLKEYAKSQVANLVIIESTNKPRSFSAGGDVAFAALKNLNGKADQSIAMFTAEYSMNLQMATYNKPIVALMDGITMGGGVGLSIHNPFRIATENTKWAMPEMDIGFFPDVGTTFALPRLITLANNNSQMALYLCMTGDILNGYDAYLLGLASHFVPHDSLDDLKTRLGSLQPQSTGKYSTSAFYDMVNDAIEDFTTKLPHHYKFTYTPEMLDVIEQCFDVSDNQSISTILERLARYEGNPNSTEFARRVKDKLSNKSMISLQLALRLVKENSKANIDAALSRDLYTAANMCLNAESLCEFSEATKHKLVDKVKTPYEWKQKTELSVSQLTKLISPKPSMPVSLSKSDYAMPSSNAYPHASRYQLPVEKEIVNYCREQLKSGANNLDKKSVVSYYASLNPSSKGKVGIEWLVSYIFDRKCLAAGSGVDAAHEISKL